jgi:hypothetical protein
MQLNSWLGPEFRKHLLDVRDCILEDDEPRELWGEILALSVVLFFSGQQEEAVELLEGYFDVCPVKRQADNIVWTADGQPVGNVDTLELILHFAPRKPHNYPWIPLPPNKLHPASFDITKPEFLQLDNWTVTEWIPSTDYKQRESFIPIDENYDVHAWKTSQDPWMHAICARLLGRGGNKETIGEAFAAADKLFTSLPRRKNPMDDNDEWPHSHIFSVKIYFLIAVGLGRMTTAREILRMAVRRDEFVLHELLLIPAVYEIFLDRKFQDAALPRLSSEENSKLALATLKEAFKTRRERGQQEPLPGVQWPGLLKRFSEAAFKLHTDDFEGTGELIEKPSDILLPPLTTEALVEVEERLGPLPRDLKDMALVAKGFKGGWHFAGGGFGGVDTLRFEDPGEYEVHLDIPSPRKKFIETRTNPDGTTYQVMKHVTSFPNKGSGVNWGPVYACWPVVESDSFNHILCPPKTWKKIKKGHVREGEYLVCHYALWSAGSLGKWRSMRHWVASMTAEMERELATSGEDTEA